jgi:hypothetical protein
MTSQNRTAKSDNGCFYLFSVKLVPQHVLLLLMVSPPRCIAGSAIARTKNSTTSDTMKRTRECEPPTSIAQADNPSPRVDAANA